MKRFVKTILISILLLGTVTVLSACSETVASIEPSFWFYLAFVAAAIAGVISGLILMITVCVMKHKFKKLQGNEHNKQDAKGSDNKFSV